MIRDYLFVLIVFSLMPWPAFATPTPSDIRIARYAVAHLGAEAAQTDLLSVVVRVSFSPSISTVGEALEHLLLRSGYGLASLGASDPNLPILLTRPLPQVHRTLGPIRLNEALKTLAGSAWVLTIDPVNRLISFELAPEFSRTAAGEDDVD